jgi:hypothetical protein
MEWSFQDGGLYIVKKVGVKILTIIVLNGYLVDFLWKNGYIVVVFPKLCWDIKTK